MAQTLIAASPSKTWIAVEMTPSRQGVVLDENTQSPRRIPFPRYKVFFLTKEEIEDISPKLDLTPDFKQDENAEIIVNQRFLSSKYEKERYKKTEILTVYTFSKDEYHMLFIVNGTKNSKTARSAAMELARILKKVPFDQLNHKTLFQIYRKPNTGLYLPILME